MIICRPTLFIHYIIHLLFFYH